MLPDTKTFYIEEIKAIADKLADLLDMPENEKAFKPECFDTPKASSLEAQSLCYDLCLYTELGAVCGLGHDGTVFNPYIAKQAMAEYTRRLHTMAAKVMTLSPSPAFVYPFGMDQVLTKAEAEEVLTDTTQLVVVGDCLSQVHQALHKGLMVKDLGVEAAVNWGLTHFCPCFHPLKEANDQLGEAMIQKAKLFLPVTHTDFFKQWSEVYRPKGDQMPWWFSDTFASMARGRASDVGVSCGWN